MVFIFRSLLLVCVVVEKRRQAPKKNSPQGGCVMMDGSGKSVPSRRASLDGTCSCVRAGRDGFVFVFEVVRRHHHPLRSHRTAATETFNLRPRDSTTSKTFFLTDRCREYSIFFFFPRFTRVRRLFIFSPQVKVSRLFSPTAPFCFSKKIKKLKTPPTPSLLLNTG